MEIRTLTTPPLIEGRRVTGYAARFNSPSEVLAERGKVFREVILPGAFTRSLTAPPRRDILALWQHGQDGRPPLGRTPDTLRLWEDSEGLAFSLDLPDSADDVREAVARRDVRGMSFGFDPRAEDKWSIRNGVQMREVVDAPLFEVSLVIRPAYTATSVQLRDTSRVVVPELPPSLLNRARRLLELADRA
ncbi:MAG TPA: HK97 family phage prohead protease [Urbifossiella sp.]|nr:HK97 family phage prohead protease [Urbifossiella sp.]